MMTCMRMPHLSMMYFPRLLSAAVPPIAIIAMLMAAPMPPARATFTIGATDLRTGQIGAAGCSCVPDLNLYDVAYHGLPGRGLVLAQAFPILKISEDGKVVPDMDSQVYQRMMALLRNGTAPAEIVRAITDPALDGGFRSGNDERTQQPYSFPSASTRQYGIVDVRGRRDGYTGDHIKDLWSARGEDEVRNQAYTQEDVQGPQDRGAGGGTATATAPSSSSSFAYSAQGNIVSHGLVSLLAEAFENGNSEEGGGACDDLVDRLFRAVAAVDDANQRAGADPTAADDADFVGDAKCERTNGAPCHTIFLHVDDPDGTNVAHWVWDAQTNVDEAVGFVVPPDIYELGQAEVVDYVRANHPNITTANPYDYLRRQYAQWRADYPCRSYSPADGTTGADSATNDSSSASSPPFGPVAGRCLGCILSSALLLLLCM